MDATALKLALVTPQLQDFATIVNAAFRLASQLVRLASETSRLAIMIAIQWGRLQSELPGSDMALMGEPLVAITGNGGSLAFAAHAKFATSARK